ncbi:MAG: hypothetical protein AAF846_10745 [Chloroflexota bacterium]
MMLFTIKLVHSLIIIYMMFCLYAIWQYALTGIERPFTRWAFVSVIAEGIVFIAYGWECPLTIWALNLGDDTGSDLLSDWLYLEEVDFTTNFAIFFGIGTVLSIRQYLQHQRTNT